MASWRNRPNHPLAGVVVLTLILVFSVSPCLRGGFSLAAAPQTDDAQVVKAFESRVSQYMDLRKTQAGAIKPTDSPAKLAEDHKRIGDKVRAARSQAKQGDIFDSASAAYFRKQIATTLKSAAGAKIRASLRHAEPLHGVSVEVNGKYPEGLPLQSTPPTLLLNLPRLPKELQYRIVGRDLVLYDPGADLIVDFIPGTVPAA